jgi:hypothetical protein
VQLASCCALFAEADLFLAFPKSLFIPFGRVGVAFVAADALFVLWPLHVYGQDRLPASVTQDVRAF